jgi:hypothetical protein
LKVVTTLYGVGGSVVVAVFFVTTSVSAAKEARAESLDRHRRDGAAGRSQKLAPAKVGFSRSDLRRRKVSRFQLPNYQTTQLPDPQC